MGSNWPTIPFGQLLAEPVRNGIYKAKEFHGRGAKIVNMGELFAHPRLFGVEMKRVELSDREKEKSLLRRGDLLFARRSLVAEGAGKCCIVKEVNDETTFESSIIRARPDQSKVSSDFLFYFFSSPVGRETIGTILRQVAVSGITGTDLVELPVPCPPPKVQQDIASALSAIDDRIALLRDTNRTLEDMARLLFRAWFVDFEPVRAKMEGRAPTTCDAATAALFPDRLVESELGDIPEGWSCAPISRHVLINDWTLSKKDKLDQIEYIEISEVSKGDINTVQSYARGEEPSRARRRLKHGDVALSTVRPDRGAYFLCLHPSESLIASTGFAVVTSRSVPWSYTYAALTLDEVSEHLGNRADGGAYPAVRPEVIGEWEVAAPESDGILEQFHALAAPLLERAHANRTLARTLAQSRDELLPRLMSGALTVPEAA